MFSNVLIMLTLFLIVAGFTVLHLNEMATWIAVGAVAYALSDYVETFKNQALVEKIKTARNLEKRV